MYYYLLNRNAQVQEPLVYQGFGEITTRLHLCTTIYVQVCIALTL